MVTTLHAYAGTIVLTRNMSILLSRNCWVSVLVNRKCL
jgi:hypothetical protein